MSSTKPAGHKKEAHVSNEHYLKNPMVHRDRRLGRRTSAWVNRFSCKHIRPLIICRGPIRKEAMDVFEEMGINAYGILLSEKDSITYRHALAPELRQLTERRDRDETIGGQVELAQLR